MIRFFGAILATAAIPMSFGYAADTPPDHAAHSLPAVAVTEPPAAFSRATVLPGPLARGAVVISFHAENLKLLPVYGDAGLAISPRVGHVHITVDDFGWHWLQASEELIVVQGLAKGDHHIVLDLADPTHRVLATKRLDFVIP